MSTLNVTPVHIRDGAVEEFARIAARLAVAGDELRPLVNRLHVLMAEVETACKAADVDEDGVDDLISRVSAESGLTAAWSALSTGEDVVRRPAGHALQVG